MIDNYTYFSEKDKKTSGGLLDFSYKNFLIPPRFQEPLLLPQVPGYTHGHQGNVFDEKKDFCFAPDNVN